jgi:hypothetical protein
MKGQGVVIHFISSLLQAAVDKDLFAAGFQTMAAAGNGMGGTKKCQFHISFLLFRRYEGVFTLYFMIAQPGFSFNHHSGKKNIKKENFFEKRC